MRAPLAGGTTCGGRAPELTTETFRRRIRRSRSGAGKYSGPPSAPRGGQNFAEHSAGVYAEDNHRV